VTQGPTKAISARKRLSRWWPWLVLSAILHLPFTPLGPLLGLFALLVRMHSGVPDEPLEEFVGIPVELLAAPAPAAEAPAGTAVEGDAVLFTPPKPKPDKKPKSEPTDAGAPVAASDAGLDASLADAAIPVEAGVPVGLADAGTFSTEPSTADAGTADAGTPDADTPDADTPDAGVTRPDPFAIAGELGKFQKGNVNVRIHLFLAPLKRHPAAGVIAGLLTREPQWQEFLGPGELDPIRDFTKIVIMGPQLVDSSQVGVFLEYSADPKAVRRAVDALVQHTEGARWETKHKKPVAYVHKAGGDRVIILYPNRGVVIVPPKPAEQMIALSKFPPLGVPSSDDEILQLMLKTPHRVSGLKRAGLQIPKSISMAKVFISGTQNGGAEVRLELDDESPEAAAAHGPDLERDLAGVTKGFLSLPLNAQGARIVGEAKLSPLIVGTVLSWVQKQFLPKPSDR
jgi:hypothetical protein